MPNISKREILELVAEASMQQLEDRGLDEETLPPLEVFKRESTDLTRYGFDPEEVNSAKLEVAAILRSRHPYLPSFEEHLDFPKEHPEYKGERTVGEIVSTIKASISFAAFKDPDIDPHKWFSD